MSGCWSWTDSRDWTLGEILASVAPGGSPGLSGGRRLSAGLPFALFRGEGEEPLGSFCSGDLLPQSPGELLAFFFVYSFVKCLKLITLNILLNVT